MLPAKKVLFQVPKKVINKYLPSLLDTDKTRKAKQTVLLKKDTGKYFGTSQSTSEKLIVRLNLKVGTTNQHFPSSLSMRMNFPQNWKGLLHSSMGTEPNLKWIIDILSESASILPTGTIP